MKRLIYVLTVCTSLVACCTMVSAQGTVNFANIGGGVNAPVSGPDGLLGAGFIAQLQLADGTNVGEPAPFLANGLFAGGTRVIEGVDGGSNVELLVWASNVAGSISGYSHVFTVMLGAGGTPPAFLTGLESFRVDFDGDESGCSESYCWSHVPDSLIGVECSLGGGILAHIRVDPCFCESIPMPARFTELNYWRSEEGQVQISWIKNAGLSLYGVSDLSGDSVEKAFEIDPHGGFPNGIVFVKFDADQAMRFFWLGKKTGICD